MAISNLKRMLKLVKDEQGRVDYHTYYPGEDFWMVVVQNRINEKEPFILWTNERAVRELEKRKWNTTIKLGEFTFLKSNIQYLYNTHDDDRTPVEKQIDNGLIKQGKRPWYMPLWMRIQEGYDVWDEKTGECKPTLKGNIDNPKIEDMWKVGKDAKMAD